MAGVHRGGAAHCCGGPFAVGDEVAWHLVLRCDRAGFEALGSPSSWPTSRARMRCRTTTWCVA
ncbi:MAG: DUF6578 domain-containing protein [Solirubrobacteraceae bacterium]